MDGFFTPDPPDAALVASLAEMGAAHDRDASFPHDALALLHAHGLLALTVPAALGGAGAGLTRTAALVQSVAQGCPATALVLAMQCVHQRLAAANPRWPAALRDHLGREAVLHGTLVNALRVEPALGTPARGGLPDTTARRVPGGWSLTGHKIYGTGAPGLAWFLVWARTDEPEPRVGNILVPAGTPGLRIDPTWDHLGLRATGSHDIHFDGAVVPEDHAVDLRPPAAWGVPDAETVAWNTLPIAALYTGVAIAARDWLVGFLRTRTPSNLGASLATLPRMQEAVGAIEALLLVNRRLVSGAAAAFDAGHGPDVNECNLIKTVAAENAIAAVHQAVALTGNHGLSRANPLERHLRDVLCARIHTPQADAAHASAGRAVLGL